MVYGALVVRGLTVKGAHNSWKLGAFRITTAKQFWANEQSGAQKWCTVADWLDCSAASAKSLGLSFRWGGCCLRTLRKSFTCNYLASSLLCLVIVCALLNFGRTTTSKYISVVLFLSCFCPMDCDFRIWFFVEVTIDWCLVHCDNSAVEISRLNGIEEPRIVLEASL